MFIRIFRAKERQEVLLNVNHISRIDVWYAVPKPGEPDQYDRVDLEDGLTNPDAVRFYDVVRDDEKFLFRANPDDPVSKVFEDIYKNAVKGKI